MTARPEPRPPRHYSDDVRLGVRKQCARLADDGETWLCGTCGSPLADRDYWMCAACEQRLNQKREREERAQKVREARRSLVAAAERARCALPRWPVSADRDLVQSKIHPTLKRALLRYRLERSVLLCGPSGTGKTTWAALAVLRYAEWTTSDECDPLAPESQRLANFVWTTGHALAKSRREHGLGQGDAKLVRDAQRAGVLVLDELGQEPASEVPFEVVDARYNRMVPTIVTTGMTQVAFQERYGSAMWRRLAADDIGACIDLHGGK